MAIIFRFMLKKRKLGIGVESIRFRTPFYSFLKIVVSLNGKSKY
tara:strand:- start:29909 stop:30040 length:132 start_codon:yes stop_codon:yes gene_type:complete